MDFSPTSKTDYERYHRIFDTLTRILLESGTANGARALLAFFVYIFYLLVENLG